MLTLERKNKILEILSQEKTAKVVTLAKKTYVSDATIRRDLAEMERMGLIRRSHGGAILCENSYDETSIVVRMEESSREKRRIAALALPLAAEASTLFLDSSSTVSALARLLKLPHKTVVTTGLQTAMILSGYPDLNVLMPGGAIHYKSNSLGGAMTLENLRDLNCRLVFCSCTGLDIDGATEVSMEQCAIKAEMLRRAQTKVLLVDHTKFDTACLFHVCKLQDFDYIVTDRRPPDAYLDYLSAYPTRVLY